MLHRDCAILSDEAYDRSYPGKPNYGYEDAAKIGYEYVMSSGKNNDHQGYYGVAFKKGNEVVIVHRGTEIDLLTHKSDIDECVAYFRGNYQISTQELKNLQIR